MMFFKNLRQFVRDFRLSIKGKLVLSLSSIAVILLVSSFISIMEYSRMSNYVSELIAGNIGSINSSRQLSDAVDSYNLSLLRSMGSLPPSGLSDDRTVCESKCDSLASSLSSSSLSPLADSVVLSCRAYLAASGEYASGCEEVLSDPQGWYFGVLQPQYTRFKNNVEVLNTAIYKELRKNSATFDRGFYRSIIPGAVAVGGGLLLVLMLLFFLMVYYVNPIYRMLSGLDNYRAVGSRYAYTFDGDDQLSELNDGITEIVSENIQLRTRIKAMRNQKEHKDEF